MMPHSPNKPTTEDPYLNAIRETIRLATKEHSDEIKNCIKTMDAKIDSAMVLMTKLEATCQGLDKRLTRIEQNDTEMTTQLTNLEENHKTIQSQVNEIENNVTNISKAIATEVNEQLNIYKRRLNIVIMGVKENCNEASFLNDLFKIIWPGNQLDEWSRIGEKVDGVLTRPRPIRIAIPSVAEKRTIFKNCKLLKNLDQFKGVSIQYDRTKKQQEEMKKTYQLRSSTRENLKRKVDEELPGKSNKKTGRNTAELTQ